MSLLTRIAYPLAGLIMLGAAGAALAQKSTITLGSTNSTSSHYVVAVAMSKAIKQAMPGVNVSVVETGATVDNIRRLSKKEVDLGLVALDTGVQAITGTGPFEGRPVKDLVTVYAYDNSVLNIAVRADSGVKSLKDLDGKRLNAGIRGSGAEVLTREAMNVLGIKPEWSPGSVKDAVEAVQNRQIVGYSKYGAGTGIDATLRELMTSTEMRLLGFTPEEQQQVLAKVRGVGFTEIKDVVPGQPNVNVPVVPIVYATRPELMDDATAFAVAKAIYDNRQILIDAWPHLKDFDFKRQALAAEKLGIPLHPGAKKFWDSVQ